MDTLGVMTVAAQGKWRGGSASQIYLNFATSLVTSGYIPVTFAHCLYQQGASLAFLCAHQAHVFAQLISSTFAIYSNSIAAVSALCILLASKIFIQLVAIVVVLPATVTGYSSRVEAQ